MNKSTSYAVVGRDAGPKKLELMEKFGTKQLDEVSLFPGVRLPRRINRASCFQHGLFDLIRTLPAKEDLEMAKAIKAAKVCNCVDRRVVKPSLKSLTPGLGRLKPKQRKLRLHEQQRNRVFNRHRPGQQHQRQQLKQLPKAPSARSSRYILSCDTQ